MKIVNMLSLDIPRRTRVVSVVCIDPTESRLDRGGHAMRFWDIQRPYAGTESIFASISQRNTFRLVLQIRHHLASFKMYNSFHEPRIVWREQLDRTPPLAIVRLLCLRRWWLLEGRNCPWKNQTRQVWTRIASTSRPLWEFLLWRMLVWQLRRFGPDVSRIWQYPWWTLDLKLVGDGQILDDSMLENHVRSPIPSLINLTLVRNLSMNSA